MNCWEFMECGLGPEATGNGKAGPCPAATNASFNGCNGGVNAGRACWLIAETNCKGRTQGTFSDKLADCHRCDFYRYMEKEDRAVFLFGERPNALPYQSRQVYQLKTISSKSDDEQAIVYLLRQLCVSDKTRTINLSNVYKEIPISNIGKIVEVRGSSVVISTNELQLSAIRACGETFIGLKHFAKSFLCRPTEYDLHDLTVTLNGFSFAHLYNYLRETVRVRLSRPMNVVLRRDKNVFSGTILDISLGGCGMNVLTTYGFDGAPDGGLKLKLKLVDPATFQMVEADVPCAVIRVDQTDRPFKVALKFVHDKHTEEVVSRFIQQRQVEILKEIRGTHYQERSYPLALCS